MSPSLGDSKLTSISEFLNEENKSIIIYSPEDKHIHPGSNILLPTYVSIRIPKGFCAFFQPQIEQCGYPRMSKELQLDPSIWAGSDRFELNFYIHDTKPIGDSFLHRGCTLGRIFARRL